MMKKHIQYFSISLLTAMFVTFFAIGMEADQSVKAAKPKPRRAPSLFKRAIIGLSGNSSEDIHASMEILPNYVIEKVFNTVNKPSKQLGLTMLHNATTKTIPGLIQIGANPERCSTAGYTPLLWYLQRNRPEKAITLLRICPYINVKHKSKAGHTALDLVRKIIDDDQRAELESLLRKSENRFEEAEASKANNFFPMSLWAYARDYATNTAVRILKDNSDNDIAQNIFTMCMEIDIAQLGDFVNKKPEYVKNQLKAFVNKRLNPAGMTRLHYAANSQEVERLLELGADIYAKTEFGETPLHTTIQQGRCEAAIRLIQNHIKGNEYCKNLDNFKMDPLCYAILTKNTKLVKMLKKKGAAGAAHVTAGAHINAPAIFLASIDDKEIVKTVLPKTAVNLLNNRVRLIAMTEALDRGREYLFRRLIPKDESINTCYQFDNENVNFLMYLLCNKQETCVNKLLSESPFNNGNTIDLDVNAPNINNATALMLAVDVSPEIVEKLIKLGALVDAADNHQATSLHHAVDNDSLEAVKVLVDNGADANIRDIDGNTPIHIAVIKDRSGIIEFLADKTDLSLQNNEGERPCDIRDKNGFPNDYVKIVKPKHD